MNDISDSDLNFTALTSGSFNYQFAGKKSEAAQVIADQLLQLRKIARQGDLPFLAYLLEMAFREAFMTSVNTGLTPEDAKKPSVSHGG